MRHFLLLWHLLKKNNNNINSPSTLSQINKFPTKVIWWGASPSILSCELPLCSSESLLCCLLLDGVLHSDWKPGSVFITVPSMLPLDEVSVTSLEGNSSDVLSVEPEPEPVDDFLNRFLKFKTKMFVTFFDWKFLSLNLNVKSRQFYLTITPICCYNDDM